MGGNTLIITIYDRKYNEWVGEFTPLDLMTGNWPETLQDPQTGVVREDDLEFYTKVYNKRGKMQ